MRIVICPDSFGGTLSAVEAAEAVAAGWRRTCPDDALDLAPLSDGGPGFVDVLHSVLGGELLPVTVGDPLGRPVSAAVLLVGETAYVESAQACGLHLLAPAERRPRETSTAGVADLLRAAVGTGATRIVVGLGGSGTNDGGRGMLEALGGRAAATELLAKADLVAATDVDNRLLGLQGASVTYGPQKGATPEDVAFLDAELARFADENDPALAKAPGAGAAGGLGYALFLIGGRRESGVELVLDALGLAERVARADLVITGEGRFDWQSLRGKVVQGVAATAAAAAVPCVVLAGQVTVGRRELAAAGIESAYAVSEVVGSVEAALARPAEGLAALAARVARSWGGR